MAEYIKREDAIDYIEGFALMNKYYHPYSKRTTIPIAEAIARINETPSADVQPVVHGEWLPDVYAKDARTGHEYLVFKCSECGCGCVSRNNFCHRCGADMRKDGGT